MLSVVARTAGASLEKPLEIVRGASTRLPWAWDFLCFAVPLHEASTEGLRDIANNVACNFTEGLQWTRDNRGNPALEWTAIGTEWERVEWPDHPRHDRPSTEITVYVRARDKGTSVVESGLLVNRYRSSDPWASWGIQSGSTNPRQLYATLALGVDAYVTPDTPEMPTDEYVSIFLRWRTGTPLQLDVLGERGNTLSSTAYASNMSGTIGYNAGENIRLNATEFVDKNWGGVYSQALVWGRRLSDVELATLVADPFGWYSPRREAVTVAAPFPVGPGMAAQGMLRAGR